MSELACISIRFGLHCLLPVTLHTLLQLCRSIVSAFIACWLTKTSHCTRLLRERDTVTVSVSPDRSPIWSVEEQSFPVSLITLLCLQKLQKVAVIKQRDAERCQEWSNDQLRSDGLRLFGDLPPNSERSSFQHLTPSLKEDNDGWESSSHKAALSAHRGRCGDVVTGKAGCVSKQELPALCIAALALQRYYSHPHLTSPLPTACLSPLSLLLFLRRQLFSLFHMEQHKEHHTKKLLSCNSCCQVILSVVVCFTALIWF